MKTFLHIVETKEDLFVQHMANKILIKLLSLPDSVLPVVRAAAPSRAPRRSDPVSPRVI